MKLPKIHVGMMEKTVLALLLFSIVAVMAISYYMGDVVATDKQAEILSSMRHDAEVKMGDLDRFMNERIVDISALSANGSILADDSAPMEAKMEYLREFERASKTYASISLYDKDGIRIADTRGLGIGLNQSSRDFVSTALAGKIYVSRMPEISATIYAPVMYFSAPLYGKDGKVSGAVGARMLSSRLGDVLGLTEDDRVEVVDPEGTVVYSAYDKKEELVAKSDLLTIAQMDAVRGNRSSSLIIEEEGTPVLHVTATEAGFQNFAGNGWMLISETDSATVLKPVVDMRDQVTFLGGVMVAVAFLVLLSIMRSFFIRPLREFSHVAEEIEKGNYSARVNIKDKDEIGSLAGAFNRAIERVEKVEVEHKQVDRAKTEFMSITGHELRSPMTPMKAQLQMLKAGYFGKVPKAQVESLDIVLRNTERLDKIIVDMLEISRIEAARLKFEFKKTDLAVLARKLSEEMQSFMPEKKVRIRLNIGNLPEIEADPDRVTQVLRNLLTNAVKFSKEGGEVTVSAKRGADHVQFCVEDSGMGIDEESQKRIFEPFFQAESAMSRKYGGTGLGLAICRGIVEAQKGRIWFESRPGKGSKFFFTVPLTPVTDIKPINLLMGRKTDMEKEIKGIFIEHIGPLGEKEYQKLKEKDWLDYSHLHSYLKGLEKDGVIDNATENTMEMKVLAALSPKKKEGGEKAASESKGFFRFE